MLDAMEYYNMFDPEEERRLFYILGAKEEDKTNNNEMEGRLVFLLGAEEENKHVQY